MSLLEEQLWSLCAQHGRDRVVQALAEILLGPGFSITDLPVTIAEPITTKADIYKEWCERNNVPYR